MTRGWFVSLSYSVQAQLPNHFTSDSSPTLSLLRYFCTIIIFYTYGVGNSLQIVSNAHAFEASKTVFNPNLLGFCESSRIVTSFKCCRSLHASFIYRRELELEARWTSSCFYYLPHVDSMADPSLPQLIISLWSIQAPSYLPSPLHISSLNQADHANMRLSLINMVSQAVSRVLKQSSTVDEQTNTPSVGFPQVFCLRAQEGQEHFSML